MAKSSVFQGTGTNPVAISTAQTELDNLVAAARSEKEAAEVARSGCLLYTSDAADAS